MKKVFATILSVLFCFGMFTACGDKEQYVGELDDKSAKVYVMGLDIVFPPMGFEDDKGKIVGFDIDLADAVGKQMGAKFKLMPINWKMKETELNSKKIDIIWNGYTMTELRKEQVNFSAPYLANTQTVLVRKDSNIASKADITAAGVRLTCQNESSAVDAIEADDVLKDKTFNTVKDNGTALMELTSATPKTDAVIMDKVVAEYYLSNGEFKGKFKLANINLAEEQYGIGFRKDDTELLNAVNKALVDLKTSGKLAEISTKWFGSDVTLI